MNEKESKRVKVEFHDDRSMGNNAELLIECVRRIRNFFALLGGERMGS